MASITPAGVYGSPSCVQTHHTKPEVYSLGTLTAAEQSAGRSGFGKAVNISHLNTTITPLLSTSKILVSVSLLYSPEYGGYGAFFLVRRVGGVATEIGSPAGPFGSRPYGLCVFDYNTEPPTVGGQTSVTVVNLKHMFLDTPNTTLPVTYELWAYSTTQASHSLYLNRSRDDSTNDASRARGSSQMILQEYFA
jgi:hypothetical protein